MNAASMQDVYQFAMKFLTQKVSTFTGNDETSRQIIASYLDHFETAPVTTDLSEIYCRLLESAQNANMKRNVIGGAIGGIENLRDVLNGFNPRQVLATYQTPKQILHAIKSSFRQLKNAREDENSLWPKFSKTILSSANFLAQFDDGPAFIQWANTFYADSKTRPALPLILSEEIYGLGYALACDFLKEIGFVNFGKPDVHITDILAGTNLCLKSASPYNVQKTIQAIAEANNQTPYHVDKLLWLIGSGNFVKHPAVFGSNGSIGRQKVSFIAEYFPWIS